MPLCSHTSQHCSHSFKHSPIWTSIFFHFHGITSPAPRTELPVSNFFFTLLLNTRVCGGTPTGNTTLWAIRLNKRIQFLYNFQHVRRISEVMRDSVFPKRVRNTVPRLDNGTCNRSKGIRVTTERDRVPHSVLKTV